MSTEQSSHNSRSAALRDATVATILEHAIQALIALGDSEVWMKIVPLADSLGDDRNMTIADLQARNEEAERAAAGARAARLRELGWIKCECGNFKGERIHTNPKARNFHAFVEAK